MTNAFHSTIDVRAIMPPEHHALIDKAAGNCCGSCGG